jgi:hypothetical protein
MYENVIMGLIEYKILVRKPYWKMISLEVARINNIKMAHRETCKDKHWSNLAQHKV